MANIDIYPSEIYPFKNVIQSLLSNQISFFDCMEI
jgi:hypothetical protein